MLPHFYTKLQQPLSTLMAPNTPRLRTLLVTVGSTLFPALTAAILSPLTLDHLSSLGVTRLIVQYGREDLSASLSYSDLPPVLFDAKGGARMAWKGMEVELMRFTDDFEGLVRAIGAVISHAGEMGPYHRIVSTLLI